MKTRIDCKKRNGSILVQACLYIPVLTGVFVLNFELIRRVHIEGYIHHALFQHARNRALGFSSSQSKRSIFRLMGAPSSARERNYLSSLRDCRVGEGKYRGLKAFVKLKYPGLMVTSNPDHHTFELSRLCRFYF